MSKFTKDEQTEIVRWAMNLERAIEVEKDELSRLKEMEFELPPVAPQRMIVDQTVRPVKPNYPKAPRTTYSFAQFSEEEAKNGTSKIQKLLPKQLLTFGLIGLIAFSILGIILSQVNNAFAGLLGSLLMLAGVACMVFAVIFIIKKRVRYNRVVNEFNKQLSNTPEYIEARNAAEAAAQAEENRMREELRQKQAALDAEYQEQQNIFETVTMPEYNNKLVKWQETQNKKIEVVTNDLNENFEALSQLYSQTGIISKDLRTIEKLEWLYEDMSTSEHDLERSTDLLNAKIQQNMTYETNMRLDNIDYNMQSGFNALYSEIEYGNSLSEDALSKLSGIRNEIRLGNITSYVQNRKTNKDMNKAFKDLNEQFDEFSKKL